jgi:hypothetical protein
LKIKQSTHPLKIKQSTPIRCQSAAHPLFEIKQSTHPLPIDDGALRLESKLIILIQNSLPA